MKELVYHRFLLPTVERFASKTAIIDGTYHASYEEHLDRVIRLADGLSSELGVQPGERFAVMALNGHQFLELYHASFLGGAMINPLNLRLAAKELEFILKDSGCRTCFVDAWFAPAVEAVRAQTDLEKVVLIGGGDAPHDVTYEEVVAAGSPVLPPEPDEDSPAILMYTGGTTGLPKGVVMDSRALTLNLYKVVARFNMTDRYVYLHQTPMFHAASLPGLLAIPATGAQSTFVPVFNPPEVLDVIERDHVNMTVMVPTMVAMLLDHPDFDRERLASLEVLAYGASPMPSSLVERVLQTLPRIDLYQGYGMTENCGLLTVLGPEDHRRGGDMLRSAGRPMAGSRVAIKGDDGSFLGPGESGEVCAQGGNFMQEYWNRPEQTTEAFEGGWYHTGDAGYLDRDGYLYLVDRVKDMIVSGGENVYSAEVENAIAGHPGVAEVAVIGIPSEQWGEAVMAIVVPREGATPTAKEIQDWARERIAGFKVPKEVVFRTEPLPLSGAMKVLKRELRAPYWEGKERAVQ